MKIQRKKVKFKKKNKRVVKQNLQFSPNTKFLHTYNSVYVVTISITFFDFLNKNTSIIVKQFKSIEANVLRFAFNTSSLYPRERTFHRNKNTFPTKIYV